MRTLHLPLVLLAGAALLTSSVHAEEAEVEPGDTIYWLESLPDAFARAKAQDKVLMICVNAKAVDGKRREEPAAKGLREVIYKDLRVVKKSRGFVCAFLTRGGSSADYGELRALGVEGMIVSPQHIFVAPEGDRILVRREYWSHGSGETGVEALLGLMDDALAKVGVEAPPEGEGDTPAEPDAGAVEDVPVAPDAQHAAERAAWIARMVTQVREGRDGPRRQALASLVENDQDGDCIDPLIALLPELGEDVHKPVLVDVVRALGVNGLEKAAEPIAKHLRHDDALVRAYVAVSLEHIGSGSVAKELRARVAREKDMFVARHMYRALGRCSPGDSKTRAALAKVAKQMDERGWTFGPLIGLAYFEGDAKAARAIEKILQKLGPPRGGRGGSFDLYTQRALGIWALAEIGDKKSADYIQKALIEPTERSSWEWKERILKFYVAAAALCVGDDREEFRADLQEGLSYYLGRLDEEAPWKDEARKGREHSGFEPKADWEIERTR